VGGAILVVGVIGMIQALSAGSEMLDVARKQTIATQIIHGEIDKLRLSSWPTVKNLSRTSTAVSIDSSLSSMSQNFQCSRIIDDVSPDGSGTLLRITFTVTWTAATGSTQRLVGTSYSRSGYTYFGQYGLYVSYQRS
jgi:hypothetical protein